MKKVVAWQLTTKELENASEPTGSVCIVDRTSRIAELQALTTALQHMASRNPLPWLPRKNWNSGHQTWKTKGRRSFWAGWETNHSSACRWPYADWRCAGWFLMAWFLFHNKTNPPLRHILQAWILWMCFPHQKRESCWKKPAPPRPGRKQSGTVDASEISAVRQLV